MPQPHQYNLAFTSLDADLLFERDWRSLEARADIGLFRSWCWMGAWAQTLARRSDTWVVRILMNGRIVGMACLGRAQRHGPIGLRRVSLSETGDPELDDITVEHNGLLVERGLEASVARAFLDGLQTKRREFDELILPGLRLAHAVDFREQAVRAGYALATSTSRPYYWVGLRAFERQPGRYLDSLSANTRHQIRRAMRRYERHGAVRQVVATRPDEALDMFSELKRLHQAYWTNRGHSGAFASAKVTAFHEHVIRENTPSGQVEVSRIEAGQQVLGYLYNFALNGVVTSYQSAFRYGDDAKLKPGLVAHVLAVQRAIERGEQTYDLLAGDARYKRSLSTNSAEMVWLSLGNRNWRSRLYAWARAVRRHLRGADT